MRSMLKKAWSILSKPSVHLSFGLLTIGGFIAGIIFWGGFNTAMEAANTEEFCISCHEMADNVYVELQDTIHWQNRSGVRATCPDCHVPHDWTNKIARKVQASKEVFGAIFGTIDTPEKFEAKRLELAQHEWDRFKANGSLECRNCHDYDSMDFSLMSELAQQQMTPAAENDQSCLDCHKGIAHLLPESMRAPSGSIEDLAVSEFEVGQEYYSLGLKPLYLDAALTQAAGQFNIATGAKVTEINGDALKVELSGWRKVKGTGKVIYEDFGMNINVAILERAVAKDRKLVQRGERKTDDLTGLPWQKVSLELWMTNDDLANSQDELWGFAESTYSFGCSGCHSAPEVSHFDSNAWPGMLEGMLAFVDFDDRTQALVLKYLQMHSSDFSESAH